MSGGLVGSPDRGTTTVLAEQIPGDGSIIVA